MCSPKVVSQCFIPFVITAVLISAAPLQETKIKIVDGLLSNEGNSTNENITDKCPRIVSRKEWGARNVSGYEQITTQPTPYVVAHHGGVPHYCHEEVGCARIVRSYQDFHMDFHGWLDIGYHFVIGGDGSIFEGRGWDHVGAHCPGYNGQGIGICIIGDYTSQLPTEKSLSAFHSLVDCGVSLGKVSKEYKLIGHRQGRATACPGDTFYQYIKGLPQWTENPVPALVKVNSTLTKKKSSTVDITNSKLWFELIALGSPNRDPEERKEETQDNVVDTGSSVDGSPN